MPFITFVHRGSESKMDWQSQPGKDLVNHHQQKISVRGVRVLAAEITEERPSWECGEAVFGGQSVKLHQRVVTT